MTRQEELNEAWCKYRGKCSTEIIQALAFALKWADAHPHWTSVEDELPRCYIPYNNYDGTPSDVLESEKVIVLLFDGTICIATFNQNLDVDTDKPTGSPYWFDEGHPEDGDRIRGEVTHWMPLPQAPKKRDKKILKKLYAKCIQSDPLGRLIVGQIYKCEAWKGKTLISGASGSMAMDSKIFLEHFTPMKGDEQ